MGPPLGNGPSAEGVRRPEQHGEEPHDGDYRALRLAESLIAVVQVSQHELAMRTPQHNCGHPVKCATDAAWWTWWSDGKIFARQVNAVTAAE